ncbi:MAG: ATP-binding protein [Oscillospiraceae bacterium]|jgi:DNA replication protein DnaC|nr:ATP-binding protein [Oscillospiraceae bacterium]
MGRDGRLLSRAREALSDRRRGRESELRRREGEVFASSPRARELSRELESTMRELFGSALDSQGAQRTVEDIESRNLALQEALRRELTGAGFPADYLDDTPYCEECGDTGYVGAEVCGCLQALYDIEQRESLSSLLKLGNEGFETFRLDLYDERDERTGFLIREHMRHILEFCRLYADTFGDGSFNLFLSGAPGLGKTFLSASIARVVAGGGHSVVYDTFTSIFSRLEDEKFSKDADMDTTREDTRRYRECDLLIADDLGAEMTTSFTTAALYELVNTRLITGRKTIISSNLLPEELYGRYSPQIASRLEGEYRTLKFYGSDIRLKKRDG